MRCSSCRTLQPPEVLFCPACGTLLQVPGLARPLDRPTSRATAAAEEPADAVTPAELSVNQLLRVSRMRDKVAPVSHFQAETSSRSEALPLEVALSPQFQARQGWQPSDPTVEPLTVHEHQQRYGSLELPPDPPGPTWGVARKHFFYTDAQGETIIAPLAHPLRRAGAGLCDLAILSGVIVVVVWFARFQSQGSATEAAWAAGKSIQRTLTDSEAFRLSLIAFGLIWIPAYFSYQSLLTGFNGQTIGSRLLQCRVVRREGRFAGILAALVRTMYITLPQIAGLVLLLTLPDTDGLGLAMALVVAALPYPTFPWAAFDQTLRGRTTFWPELT